MSILDIFKKKKKTAETKKGEEKEKPKIAEAAKKKEIGKKTTGIAAKVLSSPHIAEKSSFLTGENQYVFKVFNKSGKTEIKRAVEELYGVKAEKVKIITVHRKKRRLGRIGGWKKGYKKAIVKIAKGEQIEIMPR